MYVLCVMPSRRTPRAGMPSNRAETRAASRVRPQAQIAAFVNAVSARKPTASTAS